MTIVERLIELIAERKIVKKDFAAKIGIPQSTLQTWLSRGEDFPAAYVVPICRELKISPDKLLLGDDVPLPEIPDDYVRLSQDERYLLDLFRKLDHEGMIVVTNDAIKELRRVRAAQGHGTSEGRVV